ncbi:hypothetical protein CRUP_005509 [Coryphaenoides rupestris]|nr:hypothetical protein CRUP_005509 [Coryphaenoides rupestris]
MEEKGTEEERERKGDGVERERNRERGGIYHKFVVIPTRRATAVAFQSFTSHLLGDAGSPYLIGLIIIIIIIIIIIYLPTLPFLLTAPGERSTKLSEGQIQKFNGKSYHLTVQKNINVDKHRPTEAGESVRTSES